MKKQSQKSALAVLAASSVRRLNDEDGMQALGQELAGILPRGTLVTLSGDLGAGKSVLVRAIIHELGYAGRVKSPTYTLIESYDTGQLGEQPVRIAHLDLYRLEDPEELDYLGFDDVLGEHDLVFIEWPEKGAGRVPQPDLHIAISYTDTGGREVKFA